MKSSFEMSRRCHADSNCGAIEVGELLGREALCVGGLLDLEAVLVGAGEELDVVTEQPVPAGERVADDRRVRVAEVGLRVHVVDGCRQVEAAHGGRGYVCHRSTVLLVCGGSGGTGVGCQCAPTGPGWGRHIRRRTDRSVTTATLVPHDTVPRAGSFGIYRHAVPDHPTVDVPPPESAARSSSTSRRR